MVFCVHMSMVEVLRCPVVLPGYDKGVPLLCSTKCPLDFHSSVFYSSAHSGVVLKPRKRIYRFELSCVKSDAVGVEFEDRNVSVGGAKLSESRVYYLEERDEDVLSRRILRLSRSNKVRSALGLYRSMIFSGLRPDLHACNSLLLCILRNRMLDDALEVFEFLKEAKLTTAHTYSIILKAVAEHRGADAAVQMFEEMCSEGFDIVVYNTMISVFGKQNDWVQAERIWRVLQNQNLIGTKVTYSVLVCLFVRCGQNELALDAYGEMVQNGLIPGDDVMQAIIGAFVKEGNDEMAFSVLQSILNRGKKPNAISCNAVINSLGKAGKPKLAFKVYDLMKSLGHEPDSYTWNSLLCSLNRVNRHAEAIRWFEGIKNQQPKILNFHIYNTVLISCKSLGLWEKAVELLWEMETSGHSVSTSSYNLVISACEVARRPKVALQVYSHMVHRKCSPDLFTLLSLIRSCIWGSLWDEVEEILNSSAPNGSLYNTAIQGMCLRGRADLAKKLYMKMQQCSLKADGKTRALMLQNLPKDISEISGS